MICNIQRSAAKPAKKNAVTTGMLSPSAALGAAEAVEEGAVDVVADDAELLEAELVAELAADDVPA